MYLYDRELLTPLNVRALFIITHKTISIQHKSKVQTNNIVHTRISFFFYITPYYFRPEVRISYSILQHSATKLMNKENREIFFVFFFFFFFNCCCCRLFVGYMYKTRETADENWIYYWFIITNYSVYILIIFFFT